MRVRTPNANTVEFNCGGFETLCEALDYAASGVGLPDLTGPTVMLGSTVGL